jgi:hypothetical protein
MEAPLLDSFGMDDHRDTTELLSHSMVRGVASVDSPVMNSGEMLRVHGEDREGQGEIAREVKIKHFTVLLPEFL